MSCNNIKLMGIMRPRLSLVKNQGEIPSSRHRLLHVPFMYTMDLRFSSVLMFSKCHPVIYHFELLPLGKQQMQGGASSEFSLSNWRQILQKEHDHHGSPPEESRQPGKMNHITGDWRSTPHPHLSQSATCSSEGPFIFAPIIYSPLNCPRLPPPPWRGHRSF